MTRPTFIPLIRLDDIEHELVTYFNTSKIIAVTTVEGVTALWIEGESTNVLVTESRDAVLDLLGV